MAYEYEVRGDYGFGHGPECVTSEATRAEAIARLREYRENEPGVAFSIKRVRVKVPPPKPAPRKAPSPGGAGCACEQCDPSGGAS